MVRVAVVGGGASGAAAAREAARRNADVTLYEAEPVLPAPRSEWISLLGEAPRATFGDRAEPLRRLGVEVRNGEEVTAMDQAGRVSTPMRSASFDAVVLATGSKPVDRGFVGWRKEGFHMMKDERSYTSLASRLHSYSRVALVGSGATLLQVADSLAKRKIVTCIFAPEGIMGSHLSDAANRKLESALADAGIVRVSDAPERVAGVERVEAVVANGVVYPCQALVQIPRMQPRVPRMSANQGRLGGVVVNEEMKSSWERLFASGSCAEVKRGATTVLAGSDSSSRLMGEVAGANAAGAHLSAYVSACLSIEALGVSVVVAGLSLGEATRAGFDAREVWVDSSAGLVCSLVYDRGSLKVWGVQLVGPGASRYALAAPLLVSGYLGIDELSYKDFPILTDISPLAEAAREGLRQ